METACGRETEEYDNILYYLERNDRLSLPRQQEKAVQAGGCFAAFLRLVFTLGQPPQVN